jgi:hypothetical protein
MATRQAGIARVPWLQRTHQRWCRPGATNVRLSRLGDALSVPVRVLSCANLHGVGAGIAPTGGVGGGVAADGRALLDRELSDRAANAMKSVDGLPSTRACTPAEYPRTFRQGRALPRMRIPLRTPGRRRGPS